MNQTKTNRWKEIIKIMEEMNRIKNKITIQRINETKDWNLVKINE
jgi:hypothetical protein